ncbi:glycosyltransferase family 4 protein [Stutzerimonas kunmingensis]|uniref:glycosyltransferase family 4 protein n=1 Tax=Stutzerimonas kunmingensis TaxID=1211807 RepID=UPI0024203C34|nr:glycosyltransferase family 4 protein [Stutzerimonas kunmingensis]
MKVVLISQNASPGFLIFRKSFIQFLVGAGHEVYAFALDYTQESKAALIAMGAIPVDYQLSKAGLNPFKDFKDILALTEQLRKIQADMVFSFFVKPSIYGAIAAWLAGVPRRISMLEGLGYIHTPTAKGFSFKKKVLRFVHGALSTVGYAFANKVIFLNHDDPKDLSRFSWISKNKVAVLGPIGIDLSEYPYSPVDTSRPVRFVFVARLLAEKGIFEFIEAARLVKKAYPETEFVVLGGLDSDNPTALSKEQLDSFVDEGLVIFPGHVDNVLEWIAGSHVFVLPSYREGFPRSTQEAMSIGRAVITTDVPGCRETVVDGKNGFLVPPWDSSALAEKMLHLVGRPDLIQKMGIESHRMAVENFDVYKANERLVNVLGVG